LTGVGQPLVRCKAIGQPSYVVLMVPTLLYTVGADFYHHCICTKYSDGQ